MIGSRLRLAYCIRVRVVYKYNGYQERVCDLEWSQLWNLGTRYGEIIVKQGFMEFYQDHDPISKL